MVAAIIAPRPCMRPRITICRLNSRCAGARGGRSITSASSGSISNAMEQAGSTIELHGDDVHRHEHRRPAEDDREQGDARDGDVNGEDVGRRLLDVVVDPPAQADRRRRSTRSRRPVSTSPAASRATSVPRPPIAMPMSAALSAGASLTPSPVMATTSPLALQRGDQPELLLGYDAREHIDAARRARWSSASPMLRQLGAGEARRRPRRSRSAARSDARSPDSRR